MLSRLFSLLLLLTICLATDAQHAVPIVRAKESSELTLAGLTNQLVAGADSEREKVTAIFNWITANISYKVSSRVSVTQAWRRRMEVEEEDAPLKPLDERVAENVLARREAVCDGYARLFKTLCGYAGIRAVVVNGYARGSGTRGFRSNHSWNAVQIDGKWFLVDATWAAGYVGYFGDYFIRNYDPKYFLAPPQQFIADHYPEDLFWTLMQEAPVLPEFKKSPFHQSGFVRNNVIGFAPSEGLLEAAEGDTLLFELETNRPGPQMEIWDRPFGDPRQHTGPIWRNYPESPARVAGKKVSLNYVVAGTQDRWLYVVFNGESVLQYRLQVKRPAGVAIFPVP